MKALDKMEDSPIKFKVLAKLDMVQKCLDRKDALVSGEEKSIFFEDNSYMISFYDEKIKEYLDEIASLLGVDKR